MTLRDLDNAALNELETAPLPRRERKPQAKELDHAGEDKP